MNKITFPLKEGDKGSSVVNLQDALLVMLDRKTITPANPRLLAVWKRGLSSDRSNQTYGNTTTAIVKKFQEDRHFRPDGIVGRQTAAAMNKLLTEWGLLEHPTEAGGPAYKVQGHIKQADGSPLVGNLVRALDKDLRHEQLLGEARTDRQGYYTIGYTQNQFRRAEKQQADLLVRVYSAEGSLLAECDIIFNAQTEESVDLVLDSTEPEKSEYERYIDALTPVLDGASLADLTADDIVFLTGETGLNPQNIGYLSISHQLAASTDLPPELFYGLIRQGFPTSLSPLLAFSARKYRAGLKNALVNNIIPAAFSERLDAMIDRLLRLARQEEVISAPINKLDSKHLDSKVLTILAENGDDYINETLNDNLRNRLSVTLSTHSHKELASFVRTMPDVDIAASADKNLRSWLKEQIENSAVTGAQLRKSLDNSVLSLSTTITLNDLLLLDAKVSSHPLFSSEAIRLELCARFDTIPEFTDRNLQRRLLELYTEREGSVEEFWKNLRENPDFQRPGLVDEIQQTLRLSALTRDSLPLIQSLQNLRQTGEIVSLRDLTRYDLDGWESLIREAGEDEQIVVPEAIPGADEDERIANYAKIIHADLERAYPTQFISRSITKAPALDTALIRKVLELYPDLDPSQPLPDGLDFSSLEEPEQATKAMETLRYELNLFPGTNHSSLLETQSNPHRDNLARFFENSPDFFFDRTRVADYLAEHSQTAFADIDEQDRSAVTAQLKRMQRVFHVTPRSEQMHALLTEGLDSAYHIASVPKKTFKKILVERLGSESAVNTIFNNAQHIAATTQQVYFATFQTRYDVLPFVMGSGLGLHVQDANSTSPALRDLFGSMDLCQCEHCQSLYGPAAYFVELLRFLDPKVLPVLINRRPDLPNIRLNCDNAMTPMPYVDLVNEILEYIVANKELKANAAHDTSGVSADELRANPQYVNSTAYENLSTAQYPITLPFDVNIETARTYLEHLGSSLHEVMTLFLPDDTQGLQRKLDAESLKISPEEYKIFTGKDVEGNSPLKDPFKLAGFSTKDLTYEIGGIATTKPWFNWPIEVRDYLKRTGLEYSELVDLLRTRFVNPDPSSDQAIILYAPPNSECDLDVTRLQHADGSIPDANTQTRINRFVRLWRKLGWPLKDVDLAVMTLTPDVDQSDGLPPSFLHKLARAEELRERLKLSLEKLLTLWADIDTHGDDSLYARLFLNKAAQAIDKSFLPEIDTDETISAHVTTLLSAFRISETDLVLIRKDAGLTDDNQNDPVKLSLANVSLIYRYTELAKGLSWSIANLIALKNLSGLDPFGTPDKTAVFVDLAELVSQSNFSMKQLAYLYMTEEQQASSLVPKPEQILNLIATLRSGLEAIAAENAQVETPDAEITQNFLAKVYEAAIAERTVTIVQETAAVHSVELDKLPDSTAVPGSVIEFPDKRIWYNAAQKCLCCAGLLTATQAGELLTLSDDAAYTKAVQELLNDAETFRNDAHAFLSDALSGFLGDLDVAGQQLIDVPSVKDDGKKDEDAIRAKFEYLLEQFLPYLRDRLSRGFVKQTLSETLQLEPENIGVLLERLLPLPFLPGATATRPAMDDMLAVITPGLTATYYEDSNLTGTSNTAIVQTVDYGSTAEGKHRFAVPDGVRSARWEGLLLPPGNDEYIFECASGISVSLWIDGELAEPDSAPESQKSAPITLKAGKFYKLRLEVNDIPDSVATPECVLRWQSATIPRCIIPETQLYPKTIVDAFTTTFRLMHKAGLLLGGFQLTTEELAYLSGPQFQTGVPGNAAPFNHWQRICQYVRLRNSLGQRETRLTDLFAAAATESDQDDLSNEVVARLLEVAGWGSEQVTKHWLASGKPIFLTNAQLCDDRELHRLQECVHVSKRIGIGLETLSNWAIQTSAQEIKDTVRAKYDEENWHTVVKPLNDQLRERSRKALLEYLLVQPEIRKHDIETTNQLYAYLLIDVEMSPCMITSRLKQAIASVQLFVQRCLMNLEQKVSPDNLDDEQWEWMKNYRVWEANRKVFLYPENWIEPEFRDNKTPFFKELESELLQNDLTPEYVETLFLNYLKKLDEVAHLEICGMYWEGEQNGRDPGDGILHVFGRTLSKPHRYFYRRWEEGEHGSGIWTPWERVNLNIESDPVDDGVHLIPVVFNRRLYLFWPVFQEAPDEKQHGIEGLPPKTHWEIQLAWSEYWDNKWAAQNNSDHILLSNQYMESSFFDEKTEDCKSDEDDQEYVLIKDELKQALFDPDPELGRIWREKIYEKTYTEKCTIETIERIDLVYLPTPLKHFFRSLISGGSLIIDVCRAFEILTKEYITVNEVIIQRKVKKTVKKEDNGTIARLAGENIEILTEEIEENRFTKRAQETKCSSELERIGRFIMSGHHVRKISPENSIEPTLFPFDTYSWINRNELNSINSFMRYTSYDKQRSQFNLADANLNNREIFEKSTKWKALFPHQRPLPTPNNTSLYPFFFTSGNQTFFVRPITETFPCPEEKDKLTIPSLDEELYHPIQNWHDVFPDPIDERIFDASNVLPMNTLAESVPGTTVRTARSLTSRMETPVSVSGNFFSAQPMLNTGSIYDLYLLCTNEKLKFENHYHPYVCHFIQSLNAVGIPAMLSTFNQGLGQLYIPHDMPIFEYDYQPTDIVVDPHPGEKVDFEPSGAYSLYNWELFFHIPLLIATRLMQDQRFAAAREWFHYIFNPTDSSPVDPEKPWNRYWKVLKFKGTETERLAEFLRALSYDGDDPEIKAHKDAIEDQITDWQENPFQPHRLARFRLAAYQKSVVMKYIDNLIQWGDRLFRQDSIESINEAAQLYLLAQDILGPRPQEIPPRGHIKEQTYQQLKGNLDQFGNALVPLEEEFPYIGEGGSSPSWGFLYAPEIKYKGMLVAESSTALSVLDGSMQPMALVTESPVSESMVGPSAFDKSSAYSPIVPAITDCEEGGTFYFCIPQNDTLLEYWDRVEDRLFKIRHCMNIEGVVRELPLYQPPIDPALLVQAAAKGIDIGGVLDDLNAQLPYYRFNFMLQKALELCAEIKSLGSMLLSVLEKSDAEELASLRAIHELSILNLVREIRIQQRQEAKENTKALQKGKAVIEERKKFYQSRVKEKEENKRIPNEEKYLEELGEARELEQKAQRQEETAADLTWSTYDISTGVQAGAGGGPFFSETLGRANLIAYYEAQGRALRNDAAQHSYQANLSSILGQWLRRADEWKLQRDLTLKELDQTDRQILASQIREQIAEKELVNHDKQIENASTVEDFLRTKYTNQELYSWMKGQISGVFFQSYKMAYDLAKKAEKAFRFELGLEDSNYIQFGYWDSLNKGLLAGEKLFHDLKRVEVAYLEKNKRDYEIVKHVSLLQINPLALITLRETGRCIFELPEELFDIDCPGHYFRRIKSVALTVPCITGPYAGVNCTLRLTKSRTRIKPTGSYDYSGVDDPNFSHRFGSIESIVTSSGQNDSGLFETNLRDERYLPFEGSGAISEWQLQLPGNPSINDPCQFDYKTISDVILHIRYTAREGGQSLRDKAVDNLKTLIGDGDDEGVAGTTRLFSVRHEFPSAWASFKTTIPPEGQRHKLILEISAQHYPFWSQMWNVTLNNSVKKLQFFADSNEKSIAIYYVTESGPAYCSLKKKPEDFGNLLTGEVDENLPSNPITTLELYFDVNTISDLWFAITWSSVEQ